MANQKLEPEEILRNNELPFVQHNIAVRNDLNMKPVQINLSINNTMNFNFAKHILKSNNQNPNVIHMAMNKDENDEQEDSEEEEEEDDDDDDDDDDDQSDRETDDTASFHTPTPSSDDNEDSKQN